MVKNAPKKAFSKKQILRKTITGQFTLVRDVNKDYGISLAGRPDESLSSYLKKTGSEDLGSALEGMEKLLYSHGDSND